MRHAARIDGRRLSLRLREETATEHREVEAAIGLPTSIATRQDHLACLCRFLALYRPLDRRLAAFPEWRSLGLDLGARSHVVRLERDLARLDMDAGRVADAAPDALPALPDFAHALGCFYVLEGSTLGGQVIQRHLSGVPGAAEASDFFAGRGADTGRLWREAREAIDAFGADSPDQADAVVAGATEAFRAIGQWMDLRRWRPERQPTLG